MLILFPPLFFGSSDRWAIHSVNFFVFFVLFCSPHLLRKLSSFRGPVLTIMGIVLLFIFIQAIFISENRFFTLQEWIKWLAVIGAICFVLNAPISWIFRWGTCFIIIAVIEAIYGFFILNSVSESVLWRPKVFHLGYLTGTYMNRNHVAGLFELCVGWNIGFLFYSVIHKKIIQSSLFALSAGIIIYALILTGSRAGIASLLLAMFLSIRLNHGKYFSPKIAIIFLLMITSILVVTNSVLSERFIINDATLRSFEGGRILAWQAALKMLSQHSLFGVGLGNFEFVFPFYQPSELKYYWTHLHNDYLQLVLELGLIAGIAVLILFLSLLRQLYIRMSKVSSISKRTLLTGGWIGSISFVFHGFFDFNFSVFANRLIFFFSCAMLWRLTEVWAGETE